MCLKKWLRRKQDERIYKTNIKKKKERMAETMVGDSFFHISYKTDMQQQMISLWLSG